VNSDKGSKVRMQSVTAKLALFISPLVFMLSSVSVNLLNSVFNFLKLR
jgi:hypothetical protein